MAINTIEDAVNIVKNGSWDTNFDAAVNFLMTKDPTNEVLGFLGEYGTVKEALNAEKMKRLEEYFSGIDTLDNINYPQFVLAHTTWTKLTGETFSFSNNTQVHLYNDEEISDNHKNIFSLMNEKDFKQEVLSDFQIQQMQDRTEFENKEDKSALLDISYDTATLNASVDMMDDSEMANKSRDEQKKALVNRVKVDMYMNWLSAVGASALRNTPDGQDKSLAAANAMENALSGYGVVHADAEDVLNGAVQALERAEAKYEQLMKNGCKKAALRVKQKYHQFGKIIGDYFGTKAELKMTGVYLMKHGKKRFASNALAAVGFLGLGAAGVATGSIPLALTAAAGYSLYSGVSNAVFSIWEKQNAEKRLAEQNKQETKGWMGVDGFKRAFEKIKSNEKEYKKFKKRNLVLMGAGIVGAGAALAVGGVATLALGAAAGYGVARFASGTARVLGFNTNSALDIKEARDAYLADKTNEKNRHEYHRRIGAGIISVLSTAVAETALAHSGLEQANVDTAQFDAEHVAAAAGRRTSAVHVDTPAVHPAAVDTLRVDTLNVDTADVHPSVAAVDHNVDPANADVTQITPTDNTSDIEVPTEWNENMGISLKHWNMMQERFANSNISFEEAYTNVVNASKDNPELFQGIDPVKVVDEYFLKDSWVKNWEAVGVYTSDEELISKLRLNPSVQVVDVDNFDNVEAQNGVIYHNQVTIVEDGEEKVLDFYSADLNQLHRHDTMFRLERIIECGDKVEISAQDANNMIEEARVAGTRNVGVKSFGGCGEENTYTHGFMRKHAPSLHKPETPAPVVAQETVTNEEVAEPVSVAETVTNEEVTPPTTVKISITKATTNATGFNDVAVQGNTTLVTEGNLGADAAERITANANKFSTPGVKVNVTGIERGSR